MVFLSRERWEFETKQDYYFAQLCAEVRRSYLSSKDAKKVKLQDFIIKVTRKEGKATDPQDRPKRSRKAWLGTFGIKSRKLEESDGTR